MARKKSTKGRKKIDGKYPESVSVRSVQRGDTILVERTNAMGRATGQYKELIVTNVRRFGKAVGVRNPFRILEVEGGTRGLHFKDDARVLRSVS